MYQLCGPKRLIACDCAAPFLFLLMKFDQRSRCLIGASCGGVATLVCAHQDGEVPLRCYPGDSIVHGVRAGMVEHGPSAPGPLDHEPAHSVVTSKRGRM